MKKSLLVMVALLACVLTPWSWADKSANLYQAEVPVATQAEELRSEAMREGLLQVLVKVSGNPQIDENPLIKESLKKAEYYVQEFSYASPSTASSTYNIRIRYEAKDIDRLLKKAGVASWGGSRPHIVVWVAVNNIENTPEIIGEDSQGDVLTEMKRQGKKIGLPLVFPMLDVTDMNLVSPFDVVDVNMPALEEASKRYATDAMLVGTLRQEGDAWESVWQLSWKDKKWEWKMTEKTPEKVFLKLFHQVNESLFQTGKHLVLKSQDADNNTVIDE